MLCETNCTVKALYYCVPGSILRDKVTHIHILSSCTRRLPVFGNALASTAQESHCDSSIDACWHFPYQGRRSLTPSRMVAISVFSTVTEVSKGEPSYSQYLSPGWNIFPRTQYRLPPSSCFDRLISPPAAYDTYYPTR